MESDFVEVTMMRCSNFQILLSNKRNLEEMTLHTVAEPKHWSKIRNKTRKSQCVVLLVFPLWVPQPCQWHTS